MCVPSAHHTFSCSGDAQVKAGGLHMNLFKKYYRKSSLKKKILPWNENTDDIWQWEAGLGVCFVFSVMPHSFNPRTQYAQSGGLCVQNQLTHTTSSRHKTDVARILIPPIKPTSKSLETYKSNVTFKILIIIEWKYAPISLYIDYLFWIRPETKSC